MPLKSSTFLEGIDFLQDPHNLNIAVAVSGGADSLALTLLLKEWCASREVKLVALTVDHGLRPESAQEAQALHTLLKGYGVDHHILKWEGLKPTAALQEKARSKRYDLLENWCYKHNVPFLFLGHHHGDQSETYCMRLRRHSGLLGLACMRPVTQKQRVTLVRPFLTLSKQDLKDYLTLNRVPWVEDPSNVNLTFERVFWRQFLGESFVDLTAFQKVREAYDGWLTRFLKSYVTPSPLGYCRLEQQAFLKLPDSFQSLLISHLLRTYGTQKYPLTSQSLEGLVKAIQSPEFPARTAGGLKISRKQLSILCVREYRAIKEEVLVNGNTSLSPHIQHTLRELWSGFTMKTFGTSQNIIGIVLWDKRFLVDTKNMPQGVIKAVGEKGWLQLLQIYPDLKKIEEPRGALWSLPALFIQDSHKEVIHPTMNMVYEHFVHIPSLALKKMFTFCPKSPF